MIVKKQFIKLLAEIVEEITKKDVQQITSIQRYFQVVQDLLNT